MGRVTGGLLLSAMFFLYLQTTPTAFALISRTEFPFLPIPGQSCKNRPSIDWRIHSHVDSNSCHPFLARGPDRLHS